MMGQQRPIGHCHDQRTGWKGLERVADGLERQRHVRAFYDSTPRLQFRRWISSVAWKGVLQAA
jgi:hypothetical protein